MRKLAAEPALRIRMGKGHSLLSAKISPASLHIAPHTFIHTAIKTLIYNAIKDTPACNEAGVSCIFSNVVKRFLMSVKPVVGHAA